MRLWALLAALLLSSLVLAGCSDGGDDDDEATSSSTSSSRASSTGTSTTPSSTSASTTSSQPGQPAQEPPNTAPLGSLAIAPAFNVTRGYNFTLNGTDPEGDNVVWDLYFGDGGAANGALLPALVNHTYPAVGLYNATFTISDGRLQTTYNLTVNVTLGAPPALVIEGTSMGVDPTADGLPMIGGCLFSADGTGGAQHTLAGSIDAWVWTLTAGYHAWFMGAEDAVLGDGAETGIVPTGTLRVDICTADPANAPGGAYTFTATAP